MKHYDVIILGAGASGLMCAAQLREKSALKIALIDGNMKPALKLKASGGGKCNLTNVEVDASHFLGEASLVSHALGEFSKEALLKYFYDGGLRLIIRKERYYFCPKSSDEVISILIAKSHGCEMIMGHKILSVEGSSPFIVATDKAKFSASSVVVATGGASYKELGASDIGLKIAQEYRHTVIPFAPALVGLTLQPKEFWMKELSGVSVRARIDVAGKTLEEDLLFAHKGISGPVVLSASLYWHRGEIVLNFCPDFDLSQLENEKKLLSTALPLPKRFSKAFLDAIALEDKPCNRLNADEWEKLSQMQKYKMAPSGTFGLTRAEVCRGGVGCEGLEIQSLQSTKTKGLYFIGETVDVTGELGGYNFQWAFSSAVVCTMHIVNKNSKK